VATFTIHAGDPDPLRRVLLTTGQMGEIHRRVGRVIHRRAISYAPRSATAIERKKYMKAKHAYKLDEYNQALKVAMYEVAFAMRRAGTTVTKERVTAFAHAKVRAAKKGMSAARIRGIAKAQRTRKARAAVKAVTQNRAGTAKPARAVRAPGGLERSISYRSDAQICSIYCAINSEAGLYARRIHDEKGKKWFKRGVGTRAKGPKADEKFLSRAIADSNEEVLVIVRDVSDKALNGKG
jgi:hypothetical protein